MINSLPQVEKINVAVFYAGGSDAATSCWRIRVQCRFRGQYTCLPDSGNSIPVYRLLDLPI